MTKLFDGYPIQLTAADIGEEEPVQLTAADIGEEEPVQLTSEDIGEEEPVQLTAEDIGEDAPVQLTEEEAFAADRSKPGFLRRAVSETLTQLADVGRQAAAGVVRDLPRMLWQTAAAVLPGETPSAKNPQGSGMAGFAGQTVDEIDYREQEAKWDDPLRSGAAGLPGMAARSLAPNLLAALATGGASVKAMPFVYGTARGQDVFRRMLDQADAEGKPFDANAARMNAFGAGGLEGGLEYVSNLFGLGKAAKEFGTALKAGKPVFDETLSKGLAGGLRKVASEMLAEGGTEFIQEGGGELHEQLMGISDALDGKPESILDVDWRAVAEAAALGAGAGALAAGAAGGMAKASQSLGARMANSRELRDALKASTGAAEEVATGDGRRETGDGGQGTGDGGRETGYDGQGTDQGAAGGEQPADGQDIGGGEAAGAEGGAPLQTRAALMPAREDGATVDTVEERQTEDGRTVRGVKMLMPDGKGLWNPDPAEVTLAEYWLKDRMLFPPAPTADKGRQPGEPQVNASRRAGFDVKPGKSVLITIGKSTRAYTAKVVEVLDDTHVRVRVDKTTRSVKNGRDGYLDLDVRQLKEFAGVVQKRENAEKLNRLEPEQRKRVRDDAREFDEILLRGDEIAEQRVLDAANLIGGDEGRRMAQEERGRAYERARSLLGVEGDLRDPVERAAALPKLQAFVRQAAEDAKRKETGEIEYTPEELEMRSFMQDALDEADAMESQPFALDSLTPEEMEADKRRVATAQERIAQRRQLAERAAAPMIGTAGDMTGSLPGFEGTSDVPLFTEQGGGKQQGNTPDWTAFAESAADRMWSQYESSRLRRDNGKRGKNTSDYRREWETVMRIADRFGIDRKEAEEFLTPHIMSSLNGKQEFFEGVRQAARKKVSETRKDVLANEEAEPTLDNRASARPDGVTYIGGVRITPHTTYNQDDSAGMDGVTETQAPVSDGLKGVQMDLRDAVGFYRELRGLIPRIQQRLRGSKVLGWYTIKGREIELLASVFGLVDKKDVANIRASLAKRGMDEAAIEAQLPNEIHALVEYRRDKRMKMPVKLLTHELGHLIDALPDDALRGRGNILGHVAALKRYLKQTLPREPGAPEEVTAEEKRRMWSEAERMAERDIGKAREFIEEIKTEIKELHALPVSAEDIKGLLGLNGKEQTPELYAWFARQDDATKKDILKQAMKGIVDERAAGGAVREITRVVATGTRIRTEKGYSRADVAKRFKELLRKAVEDLQLIERKQIVAEARAAIPKWRGADQWEKYFDRPEEMYAELFGMYLSDPGFLEKNCPTVFRAFVAYREARPEVAKAYNQWLHDMHDGTRNRKHMAALMDTMTNAADMELKEAEKAMKSQTFTQEWQAIRFALDTRNGPIYVAVRKAYKWNLKQLKGELKSGNITREQFGDAKNELRRRRDGVFYGMKHIAHGLGEVKMMYVDVKGRVKAKLDAAGIEWITFDTYAALNRIRYELQGRAAPGGIMPDSAKEMIDELTAGMSEGQKAALSEAWNEYRKIYEDTVIEAEGMRNFLGDEMHDLLRQNKYYVTFRHRPTREDIKSLMEERRKAGEDAVKEGMAFADGTTRFDIMASAFEHGMGSLGAKIYPLTGSFDPIASATVQTLQKGASLLHALNINNAKMRLRSYLVEYKYPGFEDVKIERAKDGSPRVGGVDETRFGVVYYMERGEIKAYKTDKLIAKAFESHQSDRISTVGFLMKINNALAALQTRLRYGFWEPAYAKDRQATVAHTPGMWRSPLAALPGLGETPIAYLTRFIPPKVIQSFPKWLVNDRMLEYWESTGWRAEALLEKGNLEAQLKTADELERMGRLDKADQLRKEILLVRRGMKLGITMQQQDLIPPTVGATPLDRNLMRYGLTQEVKRDSENFVKDTVPRILKSIFAKYEKMGEQRENAIKFATLAFLDKNRPDLTDEQKMVMVSDWGGSPDFSERGVWAKNIEFMSGSFLNARKEGLKRSFSALEDHPLDFVAKKMAYSVGPAITRAALATGLASYVLKHMIPDDDERENNTLWKFAEFCRKAYSHVSDYLQKSYAVTPIPLDLQGKAAFIMTLPLDETDMAWNDIAYTLVESICEEWGFDGHSGLKSPTPLSEMVSRQISNFLPTTANGGMLLGAIMPFINTYALGKHTYDEFRQRNVLTQDEMDARFRTDDALGVLLGYAYNSSVGGLIKRWERPDQATMSMGKLHDFLNAEFVQPSVGHFLRVVSNGQQQMADAALYDAEMAKVEARLEAKRVLRESLKQGVYLAPEYNDVITKNPYILDYYQREYAEAVEKRQKRSTPFLTNAMKTDNPTAFRRLMDMHGNYQ